MIRKRLGVAISLGLLFAIAVTFLTGFIASALDLNRFAYHKYAAYLAIALAAVHVALHWRVLVAQFRRWVLGSLPPPAARPSRSASRAVGAAAAVQAARGPRLSRRALLGPGLLAAALSGALGHWLGSRSSALALEEGQDLGQVYHQWSRPTYAGLLTKVFHARPQPPMFKDYPSAPALALPPPPPPAGPPVEEVILRRRSVRDYGVRPMTLDQLSGLLAYSAGITDNRDPEWPFRAIPSSGGLFPLEVYPVLFNVEGAAPGVYHYDVRRHRLEQVRAGDFRQQVYQAAVSQEMLLRAALALVVTAIYERVAWKYVDRSYRYIMLEAGHLGQNVYLTATALGLGPSSIGAFFDDEVNQLIGVNGRNEAAVYLLSIGTTA
jgi:SagB-type dehydrogenase family enzyme